MISRETAEKLKRLPEWQEAVLHILAQRSRLNSLDDIKTITHDEGLGVETLARIRAIEIIDAILEPFRFSEDRPHGLQRDTRERTGLD